jgi:hypothetical protein
MVLLSGWPLTCPGLHTFFLSLTPFCLCYRGIYREILFLTMAALGKDHVDIGEGTGKGLRNLGIWGQV